MNYELDATTRVWVRWGSEQAVDLLGHFNVYADAVGGDGSVDYTSPLNARPILAWPDADGKIGWGLGGWGRGPYGRGSGGFGYGRGPWGRGGWGHGGRLLSFLTAPMTDGTRTMAVVGVDAAGNKLAASAAEESIALAGTPEPPGVPAATAYDDGTDSLTIEWTLSPDDVDVG